MLTVEKPELLQKSDYQGVQQSEQTQQAQPIQRTHRPWLKFLLMATLLGGGAATWHFTTQHSPEPQVAQSAPAFPPRPVETATLVQGQGTQTLNLIGEVVAADRATVRSRTSGIVKQVLVDVGDRVTPGHTIAILDQADQELALAEAQASLAAARSELTRLQTGTRVEIVAQRQAELQAAQAREQEALDNLRNLEALVPDLFAQRQAELEMARALQTEALDNLERTGELVAEGALSNRALVEAQANANAAASDRLRATAAVTAQKTENQQDIAQARALLDAATGERLRLEAVLAEATAGPRREEIEAQQGLVEAAEAAVALAELELERVTITTDIAGNISDRPVNVGDYIQRNDPILSVVSRDRLDIFLEVPEAHSGQVTPGETVQLTASALPNWAGQAEIAGVVPATDGASRRQMVRVRLDNPPTGLLPGMAITGYLERSLPESQFVISRDALTRRIDQWVVFSINQDNQAQEVTVDLVSDMGQQVAIASPGLTVGQSIVVNGGDGLRDGASVQVVELDAVHQDDNLEG